MSTGWQETLPELHRNLHNLAPGVFIVKSGTYYAQPLPSTRGERHSHGGGFFIFKPRVLHHFWYKSGPTSFCLPVKTAYCNANK